jgi:ParB-like chromosome segregation protein Spo0J
MTSSDVMSLFGNRRTTEGSPQIEWVLIGTLRPNPRNGRTHSKKQLKQIAASIRQFGFINPVIVDNDDTVLAGHGRLGAARMNGLTHVPIIRLHQLSPAQKRAYVIADNKIAEQAGWDREILAIELGELIDLLPAEGMDVSLTGFEAAEIDLLLADMASGPNPEDIVPPLPQGPPLALGTCGHLGSIGCCVAMLERATTLIA